MVGEARFVGGVFVSGLALGRLAVRRLIPKKNANSERDRFKRLRTNDIAALAEQHLEVTVGRPAKDAQHFFNGIDNPIIGDLVAMVDAFFSQEVIASVGREDLTHPIGTNPKRRATGALREAFTSPAGDIGAKGV